MTATGLAGVHLVDLRGVRAPDPFSIQTMRTIRLAWVAADIEAAGHDWKATRELALAPDRWGTQINNERGGISHQLPDLVFWPTPGEERPVAVVVEHGLPKPRRERTALEGWERSLAAGQYAQVQYVADPSSARRLDDEAARVGLANTEFIIGDRVVTDSLRFRLWSLWISPRWPRPLSRCRRLLRPAATPTRAPPTAVKTGRNCDDPRAGCRTPETHQGTSR